MSRILRLAAFPGAISQHYLLYLDRISHAFDFTESPSKDQLDSVLWYLRDTENVQKTFFS